MHRWQSLTSLISVMMSMPCDSACSRHALRSVQVAVVKLYASSSCVPKSIELANLFESAVSMSANAPVSLCQVKTHDGWLR
jgi:hypothetical protein